MPALTYKSFIIDHFFMLTTFLSMCGQHRGCAVVYMACLWACSEVIIKPAGSNIGVHTQFCAWFRSSQDIVGGYQSKNTNWCTLTLHSPTLRIR